VGGDTNALARQVLPTAPAPQSLTGGSGETRMSLLCRALTTAIVKCGYPGNLGVLAPSSRATPGNSIMPRGNPSGVRSGRINTPPAANPIITTTQETTYRFSNTGKTAFSVKYPVSVTADMVIEVKKHCSVDVTLPPGVSVSVVGSPRTGVFDLLKTGKPARSGKIRADDEVITIAKLRPGEIYRVFNGGEIPFKTDPAPTDPGLAKIPPRSSRDVTIPVAGELKIAKAGGKTLGAFDTVDSADIRSGRFVFKSGAIEAAWDYLIVELSAAATTKTYRITNTGDESFQVVLSGAVVGTLATDQSMDVQSTGGANSLLVIRALDNNKTLTGIYDSI
jgi:hypothetical protein